jgi:uncharacterized protein (TIGR03067 family)
MRHMPVWVLALVIVSAASSAAAQPIGAPAALQGRWVVIAAEHQGKPFDVLKGGVMTIAGEVFEVRTAAGTILTGTLQVDAARRPMEMDLLHADGARWQAIYDVSGDVFRLNYVEAGGKDPRPITFTTSDQTEETVVVMRAQAK